MQAHQLRKELIKIGFVWKIVFVGFVYISQLFAQVEITFNPSTSPDVQNHEIYWGEHFNSTAFYVSVSDSPHTIEDKWLNPGVEYFLFVVARDSSFNVSEKVHVSFIYDGVLTSIDLPETKIEKLAMTYPNPFNYILNIRDGLEVEIYNLLGQSLGIFKGSWDSSDYPNGLYFIKNGFEIERVILLK